ncbi:MAG: sulfite exporter TauE/SafE family protein [Planctomycetota bacterium]|nr:MAG: sulfite exporter TauE/SafE family protein [Planctomycetota bacterium]REK48831.1 MAG: sulfite exporter TauE/SafE family protein [Planctomycetota bacterium]
MVELYLLWAVVGLVGGLLAGWVGLGGGIIIAPLLLCVPPVLGLSPLDMKEVARLTIIQSLCSTAAAGVAHRRAQQVHVPLVVWMGTTIAAASLGGAYFSELHLVSSELLLGLFATMAIAACLLMSCCPPDSQGEDKRAASNEVSFSRTRAATLALGVGFLGGMVGQSGAFLTIPLLIHVLRLPTRLAIGSSLGITFCAALAGSFGKFFGGGPIVWPQVVVLVAGSLVGSQLGSTLSHRVGATYLRYVLAVLIGASAMRMWYQVFI